MRMLGNKVNIEVRFSSAVLKIDSGIKTFFKCYTIIVHLKLWKTKVDKQNFFSLFVFSYRKELGLE